MNFGLAHLRRGDGDAIMTRHRELEAAAKRVTVNGGDKRLVRILEFLQSLVHRERSFDRLFACLQLLEDIDVGTGNERRPCTDQNDGVSLRIATGAFDGFADAFGHTSAQGIDGWVVDRHDSNVVADLVSNQL